MGVGLDPGFDHGTRLVQDGIGIRELPLKKEKLEMFATDQFSIPRSQNSTTVIIQDKCTL